MLFQALFVALLQAAAGQPHIDEAAAGGGAPVAVEQPSPPVVEPAPVATPVPETVEVQPATRTVRQCTRERTGGATRAARALVCRDVEVPVEPSATQQ